MSISRNSIVRSGSLLLAVLAAAAFNVAARADEPAKAGASRLFELRIYIAHEGKLDDLNKRFREHTNKLFEKHGMTLIGYWTPTDGPEAKNTLIYILAYPNREAREKSWQGFINDPDWKAARDASEKNGPLVKKVETKYLAPTDYSPIK